MEKNQHNSSTEMAGRENAREFTGEQPGQQPPASPIAENKPNTPDAKEQHSESSFPQQEGKTLGTP